MNLNQIYTNTNKTKQTRIVKHKEIFIAKRKFTYFCFLSGKNLEGFEKRYNTLNEAVSNEERWLK